jgi:hypothetical protein
MKIDESENVDMEKTNKAISLLYDVEMEVLEEGREWTRKRLEKRLQDLADKESAISPPKRSNSRKNKKKTL